MATTMEGKGRRRVFTVHGPRDRPCKGGREKRSRALAKEGRTVGVRVGTRGTRPAINLYKWKKSLGEQVPTELGAVKKVKVNWGKKEGMEATRPLLSMQC